MYFFNDSKFHQGALKQNSQCGISLIEALVSLFVFSVGALGIAAMQTTAMTRTDDTKQRSIVLWKAQEFVDRMRSTKSITNPDGLIDDYVAAIDNKKNGIGTLDDAMIPNCNAAPAKYCEDREGKSASSCTAPLPEREDYSDQISFDIWSVFCDPVTGLSATGEGAVGISNMEVALERVDLANDQHEYRLYIEWLNRAANNNIGDGGDTGLIDAAGDARTVNTNLCGEDINVDSRLDVYCVRIR